MEASACMVAQWDKKESNMTYFVRDTYSFAHFYQVYESPLVEQCGRVRNVKYLLKNGEVR